MQPKTWILKVLKQKNTSWLLFLISLLLLALVGCGQFNEVLNQNPRDPITRDEALALGRFSSKDQGSSYFIAAPHGKYDRKTGEIVDGVCNNISWNCLIAKGYRTNKHYLNVNRPTENVEDSRSKEEHTDRAFYVYEEYLSRLKSSNATPKLYVEIHGNERDRSKDKIEIATVDIDDNKARRIKELLQDELEENTSLNQIISIENIDNIYYRATSAKKWGTLSEIKPSLHLEFPASPRIDKTDEVISFLTIALPILVEAEFP